LFDRKGLQGLAAVVRIGHAQQQQAAGGHARGLAEFDHGPFKPILGKDPRGQQQHHRQVPNQPRQGEHRQGQPVLAQ